jgi:predicted dehydrogenase
MTRLALIGCGIMGTAHEQRFDRFADRMKVVACVDIDEERARQAARVLGAQTATADFRDVLPDADAVLIALPHHLHHPVGMECLRAGKHVLMEKPLANTESECQELIAEAERQGVVLMVAYVQRYHPLTVRMGELIKAKAYGDVFHVSLWTEQFTRVGGADSWHHRADTLGGGQLFSHGCHYMDLLLDWLGEPVSGVHVGTNFGTPWMECEGTSDVSLKFASGAVGYHGATWGARGTRLGYSFHAHATEAMLEVDQGRDVLLLHRHGKEPEVLLQGEEGGKHTDRETAHFLDCVEHNERPLTDGPRSLQSLRVIWRLYEAEEHGVVADLRGLGLGSAR